MARGRFISSSISTSRKFERLQSNTHRLLYLMLLPHVDCEGRHSADARILNGRVYTLLDLTLDEANDALTDLARVNLITLYAVNGERFLEITDFHEHNKVRRDKDGNPTHEAPSRIPPSADRDATEATTYPLRSNNVAATAEVEVEVQVEVQDKENSANVRARARPEHQTPQNSRPEPDPMLYIGLLSPHIPKHQLDRLGREWIKDVLNRNGPHEIEIAARYVATIPHAEHDLLPKILDGRVKPPTVPFAAIVAEYREEQHERTSAA